MLAMSSNREISTEFQDHGISHSIYFQDPDGHQLELTTYDVWIGLTNKIATRSLTTQSGAVSPKPPSTAHTEVKPLKERHAD